MHKDSAFNVSEFSQSKNAVLENAFPGFGTYSPERIRERYGTKIPHHYSLMQSMLFL
jgi:hypothetical protein